ncbi:MAG: hypothetical protein B1H04_00445 [Planctomycetales bacterium 4484_123]|nr:MAG: hypothetical protein B1H04_00445 [Planctomycetales bacterium 4484_123]
MGRRLLIVAYIVLLPAGMLYPLWLCPTAAGEDDVVYYWPLRVMVARAVRSGHWPGWNGAEAAGVGLFADPQSAMLHPGTWLFFVLPARLAYSLNIFGAFSVAGAGAYLYLRRIGLRTGPGLFGATAFMFSGFMVGHRVHLSIIQAAAMLPWGLWSLERLRESSRGAFAAMVPVGVLTLAAGHWPTAVHMSVLWTAYLFLRCRPWRRALLVAAAAAAVTAAFLAPQIAATAGELRRSVRAEVPYSVAGENSFSPLCVVLAFFPFIMGSRTPNFFPQRWWGPWHQSEMLGYVGLVTLALAASAIWHLGRRAKSAAGPAGDAGASEGRAGEPPAPAEQAGGGQYAPLVRTWTWLLLGAGLWTLGYYLPGYRLVHVLPVIGKVRCPARMLLVVDFSLAALAGIGAHCLCVYRPAKFARTVLRWGWYYLPICMALGIVAVGLLAIGGRRGWWPVWQITSGTWRDVRAALRPTSPALVVPAALAATTAAVLWAALRAPGRRAWWLVVLLLADLFFLARFVDVPADWRSRPGPVDSPAARWLRANAPKHEPYRVWGLSRAYHHRPAELLLPKACAAMGFESIAYYGPFQPAGHALLFGFRPWGHNEHWQWLLRRNHLLSLYNVRYILAADERFRRVLESVRVPVGLARPVGANLLGQTWELQNATRDGRVLKLRAGRLWSPAWARQRVSLREGQVYRIELDVRAPGGAGGLVRAGWWPVGRQCSAGGREVVGLRVDYEQVRPQWRHFEKTFRVRAGGEGVFEVLTPSESLVEVRNAALRPADWPAPVNLGGRLKPGQRVYLDRTPGGLAPARPGDPRVHIYENLLCLPRAFPAEAVASFDDAVGLMEALRWRPEEYDLTRQVLVLRGGRSIPRGRFVSEALRQAGGAGSIVADGLGRLVAEGVVRRPGRTWWWCLMVPAAGAYVLGCLRWASRMN